MAFQARQFAGRHAGVDLVAGRGLQREGGLEVFDHQAQAAVAPPQRRTGVQKTQVQAAGSPHGDTPGRLERTGDAGVAPGLQDVG